MCSALYTKTEMVKTMNYKLLAADMDGTLLNDKSIITKRTITAIKSAVDAGVVFVVSTGRPMCGVSDINALFTEDMPVIVFNGAMAVTGKSGKILFSRPLDFQLAGEIYNVGMSRNVPVAMWCYNKSERLYVSSDCDAVRDYQTITGAKLHLIDDFNMFKDKHICKMLWIDTPENAALWQVEMNMHFGGKVNCHTTRPYLLEFVDAGASKALAMEAIGNVYNIDKSEMIAVGDGYNDLSMLKYAGLGVAMGNAPEEIKKVCKYVTLSNNEDGVAELIDMKIVQSAKCRGQRAEVIR